MQESVTQLVQLGALWVAHLQDLFAHIGRRFGRREMQERALQYLVGLLSPLERKNGWQLAEAAQHTRPYSMQHLLDRAHWEADTVNLEFGCAASTATMSSPWARPLTSRAGPPNRSS